MTCTVKMRQALHKAICNNCLLYTMPVIHAPSHPPLQPHTCVCNMNPTDHVSSMMTYGVMLGSTTNKLPSSFLAKLCCLRKKRPRAT